MMHRFIRTGLYGLLAIIFAAGCGKDLPLPDVNGERKIILLGELIAGDSIYFRAGISIPLSGKSVLSFQLPVGMTGFVQDGDGAATALNTYVDTSSYKLYTLPYFHSKKINDGNVYTVSCNYAELGTASATVKIPAQIDALITDTSSGKYANDSVWKIKVLIKDPANTANYYVIEAVKQLMNVKGYFMNLGAWQLIDDNRQAYETLKASGNVVTKFDTTYYREYIRNAIYTADPNTENVYDAGSFTPSKRVLLKDLRFNGNLYETDVYVVKNSSTVFSDAPKGRIIIYVKSVTAEYYKFLKAYETYSSSTGFTTTEQPVKMEGNVQNGMGIVGGVSQIKYIFLKDNWNY